LARLGQSGFRPVSTPRYFRLQLPILDKDKPVLIIEDPGGICSAAAFAMKK
jgi:hypothetical protein